MKFYIAVLLFAAIFVFSTEAQRCDRNLVKAEDGVYQVGTIGKDDEIIFERTYDREKKSRRQEFSAYIMQRMDHTAKKITAIRIKNFLEPHGATAEVFTGGANCYDAAIRFSAKRNKPIKSEVLVYGH